MSWLVDRLSEEYWPSNAEIASGWWLVNAKRHALKVIADGMRDNPMPHEAKVWEFLRAKPLGTTWKQQKPLFGFILDFACSRIKTAIEVDGAFHTERKDEARDAELWRRGWQTLRFTNSEVDRDFPEVCRKIVAAIEYELGRA